MLDTPDTRLPVAEGAELDSTQREIMSLIGELALPSRKKRLGEYVIDKLDLFSGLSGSFGPNAVIRSNKAVYKNPQSEDGQVVIGVSRTRYKEASFGLSGGWYGAETSARVDVTQPGVTVNGNQEQEIVLSAAFGTSGRDTQTDDEVLGLLRQVQQDRQLVSRTSSRDTN